MRAALMLGLLICWARLPLASAQIVRLTQDEALRIAFPEPASLERRTAFLTDGELQRARALAGDDVPVTRSVVTYYIGARDDAPVGAAYFDAHAVRSLAQVLMIVVNRDGRVGGIEVLKFEEPPEYAARAGWLDMFTGRTLDGSLSLKRAIPNLTGASLTSQAVVRAVRRALALHRIIDPFGTQGESE